MGTGMPRSLPALIYSPLKHKSDKIICFVNRISISDYINMMPAHFEIGVYVAVTNF